MALHFLLVLSFGSIVLVRQQTKQEDFEDTSGGLVNAQPPAPVDSVQPLEQPSDASATAASAANAPSLSAITTLAPTQTAFTLPSAAPVLAPSTSRVLSADAAGAAAPSPTIQGIPTAMAKAMKGFTQAWRAPGDSGTGVGKDRAFKFTAYVAKYHGGDWDSTVRVVNGKIVGGSLPNLLYIIRKWSSNKIDADPEAVPLDLASDDLFTKRPPFVILTGHRDFKLTDQEVDNLQKYLQLGGAIWGDSSLPGERSRFDIAFRREMKRVLSDQDIQWETLPVNHPLYTQTYFPEIRAAPPGLNYYQEPVYALKLFGEIAVLYTANDYADMWQIGINERGEYDLRKDENDNYVAINNAIYTRREVYFRDLELKPLIDSYKFGTNIVLHLLTRWEDKLRNVPTGL